MGCQHDGNAPQRPSDEDECDFGHPPCLDPGGCGEDVTPCRETACLRDPASAAPRRRKTQPKLRLSPYRTSPQRNARPDALRSGIPETVPSSMTRNPEALSASWDVTGIPRIIVTRRHRWTGLNGSMPLAPQAGRGRASQTAIPARTRANSIKGAASRRPTQCDLSGMRVITKPLRSLNRPTSFPHGIAYSSSASRPDSHRPLS